MTKKRKRFPDLNQKLERPWCFYCERDFDDLKILISHQKAKHFKCDRCGRRLNTAGGLSVHMNQVHKEALNKVENAITGRQDLDNEIFGMEGVPEDILDAHRDEVVQKHFAEERERQRLTGNPSREDALRNGEGTANKRAKLDTLDQVKKRSEQRKIDLRNGVLPTQQVLETSKMRSVEAQHTGGPPGAPPNAGVPPFPPGQFPSTFPPVSGGIPGAGGLPQRPGSGAPPPGILATANTANTLESSVDELIADVKRDVAAQASAQAATEKKAKKGKDVKMIFFNELLSPEEKMAMLPRYGEFMRA